VARDSDPGRLRLTDIATHVDGERTDEAPADEAAEPAAPARKATVPSWDEIMFGRRRPD
jgi:hypothetical protein